ncbi:MAG: class I SAM-dependent methyltransferase [Saprospiraceae bacterium]|nr:class I SAM-dependent methyltransferase [Saprospiraceae bacterium]
MAFLRKLRYRGAHKYWEHRYRTGGNSGAGSSGALAQYKASIVNDLVKQHAIQSIVDFGCGDGEQLRLAEYPAYLGLDISPSAIQLCRIKFEHDHSKKFAVYHPDTFDAQQARADLALSMEVIFHLTEEGVYQAYMKHLFASATRFVVIFSSNEPDNTGGIFPHFKPRVFLPHVPAGWKLTRRIENPHRAVSISDFYIFEP